jgi:uncharacterized protein YbjT (DUF2867 family)
MSPSRSKARPAAAHSVLLAGATGLVGRELTRQLLHGEPPAVLHALVRRKPEPADARVDWLPVDFAALPALPAAEAAYCCLGTTIKQAGSMAAFRAVDFDAVLAFARAAHAAGARCFAVVSALGASPRSAGFYNRVKGEMEDAVASLGFASVVIARPSLLAGDRESLGQPSRSGEKLALALTGPFAALLPKSVRPIQGEVVARALIAAVGQARPGVRIVESRELQDMGQG